MRNFLAISVCLISTLVMVQCTGPSETEELSISLDGELHESIDVYPDENSRKYGDAVWHAFGLDDTSHTLRGVILGEPYESSRGRELILENLVVFP